MDGGKPIRSGRQTPADYTPSPAMERRMESVLGALCRAHQHRVVGLEKLPAEPFVIAVNHSLATYDIGLLLYRIWEHEHRWVRGLGDHALFLTPGLGRFCRDIGIVEGDPGTARQLLAAGWDLV